MRLTPLRVIRSEWIKQVSLRSVLATTAGLFVVIVGFGLMAALVASGDVSAPTRGPAFASGDPLSTVLTGAFFAVLIVAVLGVLAGAREYSSGMIRSTFSAVPRRLTVFAAKVATFTALVLPVVALGVRGAYFGGMAVLGRSGSDTVTWGDEGVARAVIGMIGYLWGIGLLGIAFGFLLRSIAGGLAVLLGGLVFIPTLLTALLPDAWDAVLKYLPSNAGAAFTSLTANESRLPVGEGIAVFSLWVVVGLVAAAIMLRTRDV
jgi:ABC-type transport system involved in multi-copper enzyme maturation permease subunit